MLVNYDYDVNALDINKAAICIASFLIENDMDIMPVATCLAEAISSIHKVMYKGDKEIAKIIKSQFQKDISALINNKDIQTPAIQAVARLNIAWQEKLNVAIEIMRWVEFYLHSETKLREIGQNLDRYKQDINAITYFKINSQGKKERICPYDPDRYFNDRDWEHTMREQAPAINEYLAKEHIHCDFSVNQVVEIIKNIMQDYTNPIFQPDSFELGFFNSVQHIRSKAYVAVEKVRRYVLGQADYTQFGLSESKSPISSNEAVMQTLHAMGYRKNSCPMVLANIFYPTFSRVKLNKQPGQIAVDFEADVFEVAPGLGPAYKVRFVFNTDANIQNLLAPLADLIQEADKLYDTREAYNDQMKHFDSLLHRISDAYCIDATGYSDYLARIIYTIMMKIYGLPDDIVNLVLDIFALPLKIKKETIPVKFGAMQGCKLVVFLMNQANRLMGVIAHRLGAQMDDRINAGDDLVSVKLDEGEFSEREIDREIAVMAMFNSPCNKQKTAWLARDGYFDYCSKYFAKIIDDNSKYGEFLPTGVMGISSIPPKLAGKQIISYSTIAEWCKVAEIAHISHVKVSEFYFRIRKIIYEDLQSGCYLPNAYKKKWNVADKEKLAMQTSWKVGGLCEPTEMSKDDMLKLLRVKMSRILSDYQFDASGIFLILNIMDDQFKSTQLYKALGTLQRQSVQDIIKMLDIINSDSISLDKEDLEWALERVNRYERNIIRGESISRNVSTYHRKTPDRDIDMFLTKEDLEAAPSSFDEFLPKDCSLLETSVLLKYLSRQDYTDIDNLREYARIQSLLKKYRSKIIEYRNNAGISWLGIDEGDGNIVRLQAEDSYYKRFDGFKRLEDMQDQGLRELAERLRDSDALKLHYVVNHMCDNILESQIRAILKRNFKDLLNNQLNKLTWDLLYKVNLEY